MTYPERMIDGQKRNAVASIMVKLTVIVAYAAALIFSGFMAFGGPKPRYTPKPPAGYVATGPMQTVPMPIGPGVGLPHFSSSQSAIHP